jgi:hypothetical protein
MYELANWYHLVANYYDNLSQRDVVSTVEPGYLRKILPTEAPEKGEEWKEIQKDIEGKIMPGITHWYVASPRSSSIPFSRMAPGQLIQHSRGRELRPRITERRTWTARRL